MRYVLSLIVSSLCLVAIGCGPSRRGDSCTGPDCTLGTCEAGQTRDCYTGIEDTMGVGPCVGGEQTCTAAGQWGNCVGEVIPVGETCGDAVDNNCDGAVDNDEDRDGDGFTTCGGDCCDSTECSAPVLVNPSAFDSPGNLVDDDCNGQVDDTVALCDQGIASNATDAMDYAKAIDICQVATMADAKWGVISASFTLADGTGTADATQHSVRPKFGTGVMPQGGLNLAVLSSGAAAAKGDTMPDYVAFESPSYQSPNSSGFPADFVAANGGTLPNAPGCAPPSGAEAKDPVMLNLEIRVPSNAHSFSLKSNFYSSEFPEYTCSQYNDFFVVLLDSVYTGNPANPMDKNLAFYTAPDMTNYPVGVNLASGDTGLFTQCVNGATGCFGTAGSISTCIGTNDLTGTGFDDPSAGCGASNLMGGATGWLTTSGNVNPGEIIKLRIAIWDTSDQVLDSLALIDAFTWSVDSTQPGTVILREDQPNNPFAVDSTLPLSLRK